MGTYVAFPSRRNTHDKVHSSVALTIFFEVGFRSNFSCCWLDSRVAYFFILIFAAATWRLFPVAETCWRTGNTYECTLYPCNTMKYIHIYNSTHPVPLTSSITNVQSLSSNSWVRGSLNSVTDTVWLSGTAQLMTPFNGSLRLGSQSRGSELTLLLRLVQTTLSLFGFLHNVTATMLRFLYRHSYDNVSTQPEMIAQATTLHYPLMYQWKSYIVLNYMYRGYTLSSQLPLNTIRYMTCQAIGTKMSLVDDTSEVYVPALKCVSPFGRSLQSDLVIGDGELELGGPLVHPLQTFPNGTHGRLR